MVKVAIPLLQVSNSAPGEDFYGRRLGFRRDFAHRGDDSNADPAMLASRLAGTGDEVAGGGNRLVEDGDGNHSAVYRRMKSVPVKALQEGQKARVVTL